MGGLWEGDPHNMLSSRRAGAAASVWMRGLKSASCPKSELLPVFERCAGIGGKGIMDGGDVGVGVGVVIVAG